MERYNKPAALFLIGLVLFAGTIRCSKDDDSISAPLIGKWQGESLEAKITVFGLVFWEESDDDFDAEIEFQEGGVVTANNDGQEATGTWHKDGSKLHLDVDLGITGFDGPQELTIKELTDSDLELFLKKDTVFEDPDSGFEVEGTLTGTARFTRVP